MKNVLLLFVLSMMSVFIFSMQDSLSSEQIIQQCNQDIAHAQAHIRDIDGLS